MIGEHSIAPDSRVRQHDQDQAPVHTDYAWPVKLLLCENLQLSYALDGAKDNTEMEAFISRFKNENPLLLLDAATLKALEQIIDVCLSHHNEVRHHLALSNQLPVPVAKALFCTSQRTSFIVRTVLEEDTKTYKMGISFGVRLKTCC